MNSALFISITPPCSEIRKKSERHGQNVDTTIKFSAKGEC